MSIFDKARDFLFPKHEEAPVDATERAHRLIEQDKKRIGEFGGHIADVIAELKRLQAERPPLQADVDKWERLKGVAAGAGDEASVRTAVVTKVAAQKKLEALDAQITEANNIKLNLELSYREAQERIDAASGKVPLLTAQRADAEMREHLAKADVNGPQAESAEGAVAALEADVVGQQAHAAAYETMAVGTVAGAGRVADHAVDVKAVDAEVQAAMAAAKGK